MLATNIGDAAYPVAVTLRSAAGQRLDEQPNATPGRPIGIHRPHCRHSERLYLASIIRRLCGLRLPFSRPSSADLPSVRIINASIAAAHRRTLASESSAPSDGFDRVRVDGIQRILSGGGHLATVQEALRRHSPSNCPVVMILGWRGQAAMELGKLG